IEKHPEFEVVQTSLLSKLISFAASASRRHPRLTRTYLFSIDLSPNDGDGLLIDLRRVPAFDRGEVGLAGLIARTAHPAMAFEEVRGGGERVGLDIEIHHTVAVAVDAVEQNVLRQELRLTDLAMHAALGARAHPAAIAEGCRGKK